MDLHALIGLLDHRPIEQPVSLRASLPEMPLMGAGAPVQGWQQGSLAWFGRLLKGVIIRRHIRA
jgi:hypothetical protein